MILQKIRFPNSETTEESREMYYRKNGNTWMFNTYFNVFSLEKWIKYTNLSHMFFAASVCGAAEIAVWNLYETQGELQRDIIVCKSFSNEEKKQERMEIPLHEINKGILYIEVNKKDNSCEIMDMAFATDDIPLNPISMAIDICTYKRERYVLSNLKVLERELIENEKSSLYHKLDVLLIDNGKTLNINEKEWLHLYQNKNAGGTAGFTRGMIEARNLQDKEFTHIILMDDDVTISAEGIERTYAFLQILKAEYQTAMIGGAMLRMDYPYLQQEAGAAYEAGHFVSFHRGLDLRKEENILFNEKEEAVEYNAWWYCCIPIKVIEKIAYPLPFFIHGDDAEYGLRSKEKIILLNGICVWHNSFEHKRPSVNEYYDIRNSLIVNSIYITDYNRRSAEKMLLKRVLTNLFRYRYKDAALNLLAAEDYLKGISWLKGQDGELLHQKIMSLGYQYRETNRKLLEKRNCITVKDIVEGKTNSNQIDKKKLISLNGWLLPAHQRRQPKSIMAGESPHEYYREKKVFIFDPDTEKGFWAEKKWREFFAILKRFLKVNNTFRSEFQTVRDDYKENYKTLCSKAFWDEYLDIKGGKKV